MTFVCDIKDGHQFKTDDPAEFKKHKSEVPHEYHGRAPCENCGNEVKFSKTVKLAPARAAPVVFCKECQKDV